MNRSSRQSQGHRNPDVSSGELTFLDLAGTMRKQLVRLLYRIAKLSGLFKFSRALTGSGLRILCYHGFVINDEDQFRESLFLRREKFEKRMRYLRNHNFPVLTLEDAVAGLRSGVLPRNAVVVTIDDGFHSVFSVARDVLRKYRIPATLYLTSYYFQKGTPIFELAIAYMFWKSTRSRVDLSGLGIPEFDHPAAHNIDLSHSHNIVDHIVNHGEIHLDEPQRVALSRRLAERLEVDYEELSHSRIMSLINRDELRALENEGVRIELHTHRHQFPLTPDIGRIEVEENRLAVEPIIGRPMTHFCYPSGEWSRQHWPILHTCGIKTATTCDAGFAYANTHPFALPRILDDNRVSFIEFEAELHGFSEIIRWVRGRRPPRSIPELFTSS